MTSMISLNMGRRNRNLIAAALVLVLLCVGVVKMRSAADGLKNAFSARYWYDRWTGAELFNSSEQYLKRGPRGLHQLVLTFDDGPHPKSAASILDTLKQEQVHAAFFVVGKRVKQDPQMVKRMIDEGHEVGNHTQDHLRLDQLTPKQIDSEIVNCAVNVRRACGRDMHLLRPPGMRLTPTVTKETEALGYTVVGWNIGAKDFIPDQQITDMSAEQSSTLRTTPDQIVERVLRQVKDGTIILLHDNPTTAQALPQIITALKAKGYQFVPVTKFLEELPRPVSVVANPPATPAEIAKSAASVGSTGRPVISSTGTRVKF